MRQLITSILIAVTAWQAFAAAPDPCDLVLMPSSTELRMNKPQAIQVQRNFYELHGIPAKSEDDKGLIGWLKFNPAKHKQIVLFSMNNFFGDSLIFHFSMIDFFRTRYPGVKIKVISPKAGALTQMKDPNVEMAVLPVRFAEYSKREDRDSHINILRERLPSFMKQHIEPGAFVMYDLVTLDKADNEIDPKGKHPEWRPSSEFHRTLSELGATGVGIKNLSEGRIYQGVTGVEIVAPPDKIPGALWTLSKSQRLRTASGKIVGIRLVENLRFGDENVYQTWLNCMTILFGSRAYMKWDSRYFVDEEQDSIQVSEFLSARGLDPKKPYVLLSLNTFGRGKVAELIPHYARTLIEVTEHVLNNYPGINVLSLFPEVQFGPEVQEQILEFQRDHGDRFALVPSSMREAHPALINGARWIVSYDSGLAHLSSFMPLYKVLTVSLSAGSPSVWRRPEQPVVEIKPPQEPGELAARIKQWVDRREGRP